MVVETPVEVEVPTFHEFAEDWWVRNQAQLAENTRADYRWRLECHLLPEFGERRIDRIDFNAVESYIAGKLAGRGGRMSDDNFRSRVLRATVKRANENLERSDLPPLPDKLTPHSLRRTFCSLLYALGEDPGTVMDEMGHTDPALALRVYRQSMRRGEDEKAQMRALVEGGVWARRAA
ncbi:MAG TPA: tyrosine-type recombinase/integrase [Solirubrobacteraceae bacterium]|nr:tyrosine-type recombinase/integrase [Solirubrobacteraceae bacterium]